MKENLVILFVLLFLELTMKKKKEVEKKEKEIPRHKGNDTKKPKRKFNANKKIKKDSFVSAVPQSASDFSSNWKKFLETQNNNNVKKEIKVEKHKNGVTWKDNEKKGKNPKQISKKEKKDDNPIWFDDVDPLLLEQECGVKTKKMAGEKDIPVTAPSKLNDETVNDDPEKITKYVALDCEMVGIGFEGKENALARVSLVNSNCECIYDKFVKPAERVVDYRTQYSGVRASDLVNAPSYEEVQKEVADILKDRILVGHALHNDLKCLMLGHSRKEIRDTSRYKPFHQLLGTKRPALRKLVAKVLGETIQSGEHSSIIDARATMMIYKLYRKEWEKSLHGKRRGKHSKTQVFMGNGNGKTKKIKSKWDKIKEKRKLKEEQRALKT